MLNGVQLSDIENLTLDQLEYLTILAEKEKLEHDLFTLGGTNLSFSGGKALKETHGKLSSQLTKLNQRLSRLFTNDNR